MAKAVIAWESPRETRELKKKKKKTKLWKTKLNTPSTRKIFMNWV